MSLEDQNLDKLRDLAAEHGVKGRSQMSKSELVDVLNDKGVTVGSDAVVDDSRPRGFQGGVPYPRQPQTPDEFQQLLRNPDKPAENQASPTPEQLNPHLFGPSGRL